MLPFHAAACPTPYQEHRDAFSFLAMDPSSPQQSAPGGEPARAAGPPRDFAPQLLDLMPRTKLQEKARSVSMPVSPQPRQGAADFPCVHTGAAVSQQFKIYLDKLKFNMN